MDTSNGVHAVSENSELAAISAVNGAPRVDMSKDGNVFGKNEKMKGLVGSYYTLVEKLFVISGGMFLSSAYFLTQKPQGCVEDTWMVIFIGSLIASLINLILLIHASYLKESGSVDRFDYGIFKWLLLLVLAFLYAVLCIILRAFASTSDLVLWVFRMIGLCLIVLGWAWFFYGNWPKILDEMRACYVGENVPVSAGSASEEV